MQPPWKSAAAAAPPLGPTNAQWVFFSFFYILSIARLKLGFSELLAENSPQSCSHLSGNGAR